MQHRRLFLAAGATMVIAVSACGSGTVHVTNAKSSAPAPTTSAAVVSSGTDTAAIQTDLGGVDRDLGSVDGQFKQTDSDLSSPDEGDVQQ